MPLVIVYLQKDQQAVGWGERDMLICPCGGTDQKEDGVCAEGGLLCLLGFAGVSNGTFAGGSAVPATGAGTAPLLA